MKWLISLTALACVSVSGIANAQCRPERIDLRGPWGQASFTVELADTAQERARGLMHRESLGARSGMVFVYDEPQPVSFWMRNTLIPLDMIFIGPDGIVRSVHENAIPHDESPISAGPDILAVLEVNGGTAGRYGIGEGTEIRHPAFDDTSVVWPCE
ncbi:DUF192 domain-containing protein [Qingshengfaniella alkalisoli]|uniref:DUF192 domain-containing protein n=1 Tax=Qingshengfaniella alkalisoli TaxID=2599296 RepID=A0A5B8I6P9_9RHOB|nr:DUF192 domain-containing protein [Qingshengfaniella alkalisoli]QDY69235.1 DUF192 domain-containing protein [Qingshengfaniella alkalisoli]